MIKNNGVRRECKMINSFCKKPLWESNKTLINVAQGKIPAETLLINARVIDVYTREILPDSYIAIAQGRIAYVGPHKPLTDEHTTIIDAENNYVAPGFLEGHVHVESSMVELDQYARAVVPHGTVGIYWDPHEIANVCGLEAVYTMVDHASDTTPLKAMITTPSCVPAVTGFEDSGACVSACDVEQSMRDSRVVGLGEVMNYPGVLQADDNLLDEINATLKQGYTVTGHYSTPEHDEGLNAYISAGISACHESTKPEDVLAKIRLGMYAQIREGSAWHNLQDLAPAITEHAIDTRMCCLVSDDLHPNTIVQEGHIDRLLRIAVKAGIDPLEALQMVTINVATCFQMQQDLGGIAPGKCADIVIFDSLTEFNVISTFIDGELVAHNGKPLFDVSHTPYAENLTHTMHVGEEISASSFSIAAPHPHDSFAHVWAMQVHNGSTITKKTTAQAPIIDGKVCADKEHDLLKVAVFERHHATKKHALGFVKGFHIHGAIAQTVAHDAHNLLVMGDNDADMALATQQLIAMQGGEIAIQDGKILAKVQLEIAGLMSSLPVEEVAKQVETMSKAWEDMGCSMMSPFMTVASMSLACIPELRLTDRGYVDCTCYQQLPLFVEEGTDAR